MNGPHRPTPRTLTVGLPFRPGRRWGRALLVGAVVTACVVPAGDAIAASRSGSHHPARPARPAGAHPARRTPPPATATPAVTPTATPAADPVTGGGTTGEEPVRRSGEDLRWWPWGPVVSGRLSRPVQGGYSTLVLQRGEITAVGAGTVTVASPDGVTVVWTVSAETRITGLAPRRGPEPRPHAREATEPTPTDSPTDSPTASPSASPSADPSTDPTAGLAVHQRVGIWGTAAGDVTHANFVIVRPAPRPTPSPTATPTATPTEPPSAG